ncbi:MAG: PASTA domain-containing protein [Nitrospiraceae bacterium]|nr:MAG: PASTA domain-containing protein [Nitrospiraceae bacterium]
MIKNLSKLLFYGAAFLAVGAVAVFLFFEVANFNKSGKVPELLGKSLSEAEEILNQEKLSIKIIGRDYDGEIPEGHIISQDVAPGEDLQSGSEVGVYVSRGIELYSMPSFENQSLEDSKLSLANLGIKIKKITWVHSDDVEKNRIIAQRPLPGNIESNEINFLVSLGSYDVTYSCPSFINMPVDDAREIAKKLGLKLVIQDKGNKIIFQKPEAGASLKQGDTVELTLGRGWGMWF